MPKEKSKGEDWADLFFFFSLAPEGRLFFIDEMLLKPEISPKVNKILKELRGL